jgi:hypothetical protein
MNAKQLTVGIIVGTLVSMIVGYVIWDVLAADFFASNMGSATGVMRDTQLLWAVIIGTVSYTTLIALALGAQSGELTIAGGLKVGAIVGFLVWFSVDFILFGIMNVNTLTVTIVDPILEAIRAGITGAAIAAVVAKL